MNATKKLAAAIIFLIAASAFSITALVKERKIIAPAKDGQETAFVLYYGSACPHCKVVEEYLAKNDTDNKLDIAQKEVSDKNNAQELVQKATICDNIPENLIGAVPLLWDNARKKCYLGQDEIINFLNQQTK